MSKRIFIGVGHGGTDNGAVANGFKEDDLNLSIALACRDELVRHGVTVGMSRTKDENDPLSEEIKECNAFKPDYAVEIHNNAGGGDGAEVFHTYKGGKGKTLAQNILNEIVAIGQNSRGLKTKKNSSGNDYYGWIRETNAPAALVECAFVDNKKDIAIIDTPAEQKKMGIAIAKGVLKTLGITWKAEVIKTATTTTTKSKTNTKTKEWQTAAIADGYNQKKGYFKKYGADGEWGAECEYAAKNIVCKKATIKGIYTNKNLVKFIQKQLGYKDSAIDGKFWNGTKNDVIAFQKKNNLPANGEVRYDTWKKLIGTK